MSDSSNDRNQLLDRYRHIMKQEGLHDLITETFLFYFHQVMLGITGKMSNSEIDPPDKSNLVDYSGLKQTSRENLDKLVIIKLNGGLGTSMGLKRAKSLLPVKGKMNFLDVIIRQVLSLRNRTEKEIPLIFMNSFNTNEDTLQYLEKYPDLGLFKVPLSFTQNKYPRIIRETMEPYQHPFDENQNWNPPGHGDIYMAMAISGVLDKLLESGIEYAFISNSDNLGAVVDEKILNYIVGENVPFLMEVCLRSEIDKKGGHLAQDISNQLVLREIAQCPEEELGEFQDIELYKFFNTNNLWINLIELKKIMVENKNLFMLPIILNTKDVEGTSVIQIETAMGAAISMFSSSKALIVPRERFAPVKKTNDLLTIWSDAYTLTDDFRIVLNEECKAIPSIILDEEYFKTIEQLETRFPNGAPSLKNCQRLEIIGDFHFGEDVAIEGIVKIQTQQPVYVYDMVIKKDKCF
ncbi:MAG: UTP--glucose-1-phosphate uridylyltransferase [Candidatus Cloacimonetes bacterium]|nr:UTP--glucose-1-phosphate uridylyltransferase [Candidatus Cloacimonadota bacterium]